MTTKIILSFLTLVLIFASGCTAGNDYKKPIVETPKSFKEWKLATPKEIAITDTWWKEYNDSKLDTLMKQVDISNQTLAKYIASYQYALAVVDTASSQSLPTLGAGISSSTSKTTSSTQGSSSKTTKSVDATLQANWIPDIWGSVKRQEEMGRSNAQSSKADLAAARLSIQILLAQSYFQLRTYDAQTEILSEILKDNTQSLNILQNQYNAGLIVQIDLLTAKQLIESIKTQMKEVEIQRSELEPSIAVLIGKNPSEFTIEKKALYVSTLQVPSIIPSELLERRPDIASAERKMQAANAQIGIVDAAWYPRLGLSASIGAQSNTLSNLVSTPNLIWAVGGSLTQTFFDGGLREADKKQAKANYEASIANYKQSILIAFQQVEDSLATYKNLQQEFIIQKKKTEFSAQIYKISKNQYDAGTANYINTMDAKISLYNDILLLKQLQVRILVTHTTLIGTLGGGWNILQLKENK